MGFVEDKCFQLLAKNLHVFRDNNRYNIHVSGGGSEDRLG